MAKAKEKEAPQISEPELIHILGLRDKIAETRKYTRELEAELENTERQVMETLKGGAEVAGRLSAAIELVTGDIRPGWKEIHLHHMETAHGVAKKQAEEDARGTCVPKTSEKLVITFNTQS